MVTSRLRSGSLFAGREQRKTAGTPQRKVIPKRRDVHLGRSSLRKRGVPSVYGSLLLYMSIISCQVVYVFCALGFRSYLPIPYTLFAIPYFKYWALARLCSRRVFENIMVPSGADR